MSIFQAVIDIGQVCLVSHRHSGSGSQAAAVDGVSWDDVVVVVVSTAHRVCTWRTTCRDILNRQTDHLLR
jgi:hypothetical protein